LLCIMQLWQTNQRLRSIFRKILKILITVPFHSVSIAENGVGQSVSSVSRAAAEVIYPANDRPATRPFFCPVRRPQLRVAFLKHRKKSCRHDHARRKRYLARPAPCNYISNGCKTATETRTRAFDWNVDGHSAFAAGAREIALPYSAMDGRMHGDIPAVGRLRRVTVSSIHFQRSSK
jgi:hypothetical protein